MLSSILKSKKQIFRSILVYERTWAGVFELEMLFLKHIFSSQFVSIVNLCCFLINYDE